MDLQTLLEEATKELVDTVIEKGELTRSETLDSLASRILAKQLGKLDVEDLILLLYQLPKKVWKGHGYSRLIVDSQRLLAGYYSREVADWAEDGMRYDGMRYE